MCNSAMNPNTLMENPFIVIEQRLIVIEQNLNQLLSTVKTSSEFSTKRWTKGKNCLFLTYLHI
jgi:hypothetical protein